MKAALSPLHLAALAIVASDMPARLPSGALSIAQSLTGLQKGTFDLVVDGDLFKANLSFPLLNA